MVAVDALGGYPVVAALDPAGQMVANQTYDEQIVLPWGWPDRVRSGRDVAMVTTDAGIATAVTLDPGYIPSTTRLGTTRRPGFRPRSRRLA